MRSRTNESQPNVFSPTLDEQKRYWDDRWNQTKRPNEWAIRRGQSILSFLKPLKMNSPKILEIGCGTGWFTAELSKLGEVTGIDLSETAIELAKSRYPHLDFRAVNLYDYPFPNEFYDVVVAIEVLPHVEEQIGFVKLIGSALKPGGYFALTMVNKFAINRADWDHGPASHIIQWLTLRELRQVLQPNFRILKKTTIIPIGNKGILRFINSYKLNRILECIFRKETIDHFKERLGCGYTRIVLTQKIFRTG